MENHLYRVEIHNGGTAWDRRTDNIGNAASFKWSSDNSSIAFSIISLEDGKAILAGLGRDKNSSLRVNDWVEITDDAMLSLGEPGPLRQVESIDTLEMSVTLKKPQGLPDYSEEEDASKHPLLRRWDFQSDDDDEGRALPVTEAADEDSDWITLEDGIRIQFPAAVGPAAARTYRSGDYWLIPARTATGDVEWKTSTNSAGEVVPKALPPHGIDHHYAPLAVITRDVAGALKIEPDCRRLIP